MQFHNWGKYPVVEGRSSSLIPGEEAAISNGPFIPRGMGRSYGDSSLGDHMVNMLKWDRMLEFSESTGILTCEAGLTFADILQVFLPKGWFPPVTPGTKFVSMGGAIASDVHGKNHHSEGSFSNFVTSFDLLIPNGEVLHCTPKQNARVFHATFGAMGLTGTILRLSLQLKKVESAWINMDSIKAANLEELMEISESFTDTTYSMAWIDSLSRGKHAGRGILMKGEHTPLEELVPKRKRSPLSIPSKKKLTVPLDLPSLALNPYSMRLFNFGMYHKQWPKTQSKQVDYDRFFYPLDGILHWNRIYGKKGFLQYQFVLPLESSKKGIKEILEKVNTWGTSSFLTVLKRFGKQDGIMNFPMEGYTLALDFPMRKGLLSFLDNLDACVLHYGGKVYLTKDARMKAEVFKKMYPTWETLRDVLEELDPAGKICSLQSKRLEIRSKSLIE